MVENPPCNAEVMGSIPGWGTDIPHATGKLSLPLHALKTQCNQEKKRKKDIYTILIVGFCCCCLNFLPECDTQRLKTLSSLPLTEPLLDPGEIGEPLKN